MSFHAFSGKTWEVICDIFREWWGTLCSLFLTTSTYALQLIISQVLIMLKGWFSTKYEPHFQISLNQKIKLRRKSRFSQVSTPVQLSVPVFKRHQIQILPSSIKSFALPCQGRNLSASNYPAPEVILHTTDVRNSSSELL